MRPARRLQLGGGDWRPRLRATIEVLAPGDGAIYLVRPGDEPDLALDDTPQARGLLDSIDGTRGAGEIVDAVDTTERAAVARALVELRDLGVVDDARDDERADALELARYDRQLRYLADLAPPRTSRVALQHRIGAAHVLILGVGGLGGWAALALACAGIGTLSLVDDDTIELSNLARQALYTERDIGAPKVDVATRALRRIRHDLRVAPHAQRIESAGQLGALLPGVDVVLCAADWPSGAIDRWVSDACFEAGIAVMNLGQHPPHLRFGPLLVPGATGCQRCREAALAERYDGFRDLAGLRATSSSQAATFAGTSAMLGGHAATEIIHHVCGLPTATLGRALLVDVRTMEVSHEDVPRRAGCVVCGGAAERAHSPRPSRVAPRSATPIRSEAPMAKDHGSSIKDDKQYEGLRKKGMSKQRAARIANDPGSSSKGGKASGSGKRNTDSSQGGTKAQKAAAGRKGGKAAAKKSS
jgi:bacteriocin biosynthesis cyclodehydratase domain-containing protein